MTQRGYDEPHSWRSLLLALAGVLAPVVIWALAVLSACWWGWCG